ncbi:MAG TPA: AAA family ATPase [Verrucomicrobiae bacterium]|nr:AAA family ATPase [Verrucomicrobiae bacterium]
MNIPVTAKINDLWGEQIFTKSEWGSINYLVGPNGSGKTRFSDYLKNALAHARFRPRYLSAERLAGLEKTDVMGYGGALHQGFNISQYSNYKQHGATQGLAADAFVVLKEKINVRIKIEAFLSSIFNRRIRFAEEGGFLKPKIQKIRGGGEYGMKESECHGLKELLTILAFIYDDEFNALIIDEPELHLHPQFQAFLLAEIRKVAGDPRTHPGAKVFFLITHSPYLLDFRVLDDLRQCVIFHTSEPPSFIGALNPQDEYFLKRLLPRLNTHHKQFFFASRPIFVEGYTDQQLFTLIQDSRAKMLGATGACFIDVNGKDEQDFFFRLCQHLKINAQFIVDLDLITRGNFRDSISDDSRCKKYASEHGIGPNLMDAIRELNSRLDALSRAVESDENPTLVGLKLALNGQETDSKRYRILVGAINNRELLAHSLPERAGEVDYIIAKTKLIADAAREAGVFLLPKGALENHLASYTGAIYQVPDKLKASTFESERNFIFENPDQSSVEARYSALIPILDAASGACEVNLKQHLGYAVGILIGNIQTGFERGEIDSADSLMRHASVDWNVYSKIFDIMSFKANDGKFICRIRLKQIVDPRQSELEFTDETIHSKFSLD